jgi:hypothetical protein
MSLSATRTQNPVNVTFLQDVGSAFAPNTRGYATLQQLLGNGYIEFSFDRNGASAVSAACGISFAVYPHAAKSSMAAIHLIAFGFCVRATEDTDRIFVKANGAYIDTTVNHAPDIRMRVERAGETVNFFTIVGGVPTLRHTLNVPGIPLVSSFAILSGRNACQIRGVLISGVTQQPPVLDLTTNVYIPLEGELSFSNIQPRLSVLMNNAEGFTWFFPDGTNSTDPIPNKSIPVTPYTTLIRLEVPSGVDKIKELAIPLLRRDGRYTPPDLSLLTSLTSLKIITRNVASSTNERRFVPLTSQFRLPPSVQDFIVEPLFDEEVSTGLNANTRMAPMLSPEALNFSGMTQLRNVRLGFAQDNPKKYQPGFFATSMFPNFSGCTNLLSLDLEAYFIVAETGIAGNPQFLVPMPLAFISSCTNLQSLIIRDKPGFGAFNDAFATSVLVNAARTITRTSPVFTLEIRQGTSNFQTARGDILTLAVAAIAGATSIQTNTVTGLNVGNRLLLQDGTVNTAPNSIGNPLTVASIVGTVAPFTVNFAAGQSLTRAYAINARVFNLESGIGATQQLRLLGHTVRVLPNTI